MGGTMFGEQFSVAACSQAATDWERAQLPGFITFLRRGNYNTSSPAFESLSVALYLVSNFLFV